MAQLYKVHGSENKFFILDQTKLKQPLNRTELSQLGKQITDPQQGLLNGADGLLVINHSDHTDALGKMLVVNADGSFASMCGNGLRCVTRYLAKKYNQTNFKVEIANGTDLQVSQQADLAPQVPAFSVEISPVSFAAKDLPFQNLGADKVIDQPLPQFAPNLKFTAIAVPNPHLISFMDQATLDSDLLGNLGKKLNGKNKYFTDGVNVNFAHILGHNEMFVHTYERGVGFTNACGTGMSATSLALVLTHPDKADFDQLIKVYNPGGMVKTRVHQKDHTYWIDLIGNATFTDIIEVDEDNLHKATVTKQNSKITDTGEESAYKKFVQNLPKP